MHRHRKNLFTILTCPCIVCMLCALCAISSQAQFTWQPIGQRYGGATRCTLISNNVLLCGTNNGILRSNDQGNTWNRVLDSTFSIYAISKRSDGVLFCCGAVLNRSNGCIFWSIDNGLTWSRFFNDDSILAAVSIRTISNTVLVGSGGGIFGGLYRTSDFGQHWQNVFNRRVAIQAAATALPNTYFVGTDSGLFRSDDSGSTWQLLPPPTNTRYSVRSIDIKNDTVIVTSFPLDGSRIRTVYLSIDGGFTWMRRNTGIEGIPVDCFYFDSEQIFYAGTSSSIGDGNGVYKSNNFGVTWQHLGPFISNIQTVSAFENTIICAGIESFNVSLDAGSTWNEKYCSWPQFYVKDLTVSDSSIYIVGNPSIVIANRIEQHFTSSPIISTVNEIDNIERTTNRNLFVSNGAMNRSTNNGQTWEYLPIHPYMGLTIRKFICNPDDQLVVMYDNDIFLYLSSDYGMTWDSVIIDSTRFDLWPYFLEKGYNSSIYSATSNGLFISQDHGRHWTRKPYFINHGVTSLLDIDSRTILVGQGNPYGLIKSTNSGNDWQIIGFRDSVVTTIVKNTSGDIFALVNGSIFRSLDNAVSWSQVELPMANQSIRKIFIDRYDYLYAALNSHDGLYRTDSPTVHVQDSSPQTTHDWPIRVYPNPFNQSTKIRYQISYHSSVSITVYDIEGRYISTLVHTDQTPGEYSINFNGSACAAGTYFVRFSAGNLLQIKKIVLLK